MVVSVTAKNSDFIRLYVDDEELKMTKIYKYLGVWIDEGLESSYSQIKLDFIKNSWCAI